MTPRASSSAQAHPALPIGVLIADDHPIVRNSLRLYLSEQRDIVVLGEAGDGRTAVDLVRRLQPRVLVLDVEMPQQSGLEALRLIRNLHPHPNLAVVVYSGYAEEEYALRLVRAGANAYLSKGSEPELLLEAIRRTACGGNYFTPAVADLLATSVLEPQHTPAHERLPERQMQVLLRLARGSAAGDVAEELSLSAKTLSTYRRKVLDALGCRTNSELTYYAIKHGLLELAHTLHDHPSR